MLDVSLCLGCGGVCGVSGEGVGVLARVCKSVVVLCM